MGRKRKNPPKEPAFQFKVGDRVVYGIGIYEKYENKEAEVLGRSKVSKIEWFRIKFLHNDDIVWATSKILTRKEEDIK